MTPSSEGPWRHFHAQIAADLRAGALRDVGDYQAMFPGCDESIAAEHARQLDAVISALDLRGLSDFDENGEEPRSLTSKPTSEQQADPLDRTGFGPYRITRELGRGGQAVVYLAEEEFPRRRIALKLLPSRGHQVAADYRRFRREADATAKVQDPGICQVFDCGIRDGYMFIAMEFVDGETLAASVKRARDARAESRRERAAPDEERSNPPCSPPKWVGLPDERDIDAIIHMFERIARALHKAHEAKLIHRDIKPGNVIVAKDGRPVLLDFGLAKDADGIQLSVTEDGSAPGTIQYMSPEQVSGLSATLDRRTDVWSLGVSLYECVTLDRPFDGTTRDAMADAIRREAMPDPRKLNRSVPRDLRTVIESALERNLNRRYATAAALAEDLRRVRAREPILARPPGILLRTWRFSQRKPALAATTAMLAAIAIAFVAWTFWPAYVYVESDPAGAAIAIDGKPTGLKTPAEVRTSRAHECWIEASLPDYEVTPVRRWSLRGGDPRRGEGILLKRKLGRLSVTSPVEAPTIDISAEGAPRVTRQTLPISEFPVEVGTCRLTATKLNHLPKEVSVVIRDAEETRCNVSLDRMERKTFSLDGWAVEDLLAADLDGDAHPDFITTGSFGGPNTATIGAIDGRNGGLLWRCTIGRAIVKAATFELDDDGTMDVVALVRLAGESAQLVVVSGRYGQVLRRIPLPLDGRWACAFGEAGQPSEPCVFAFSSTGATSSTSLRTGEVKWQSASVDSRGDDWVKTVAFDAKAPSSERLIVVGRHSGALEWFREKDGAMLKRFDLGANIECAVFDDFGSGREAVVATVEPTIAYRVTPTSMSEIYRSRAGKTSTVIPTHQDLDGDGFPEVVLGSTLKTLTVVSVAKAAVVSTHPTLMEPAERQQCMISGHFLGGGWCLGVATTDPSFESRTPTRGAILGLDLRTSRSVAFQLGNETPTAMLGLDYEASGSDEVAVVSNSTVIGHPHAVLRVIALHPSGTRWRSELGESIWSSPAIGDLSDRGGEDVVVGCNDGYVYCLSLDDGHVIWKHRTGNAVWSSPAVADLNGDGLSDVAVGSDDGHIYALSGRDGSELWKPVAAEKSVSSSPTLFDLDADGGADIVIGSFDGHVYVISGKSGAVINRLAPPKGASPGKAGFYARPLIHPIGDEPTPRVVAACLDGNVYAFDWEKGAVIHSFAVGGELRSTPTWADLDGDAVPDLIACSGAKGARVVVFSGKNGTVLRETTLQLGGINSSPATADLDADGTPDIVVGSGANEDGDDVVALSGKDLKVLWRHTTGGHTWSSPNLVHLSGALAPDVVIGSEDGSLYVFAGKDGRPLRRFKCQGAIDASPAVATIRSDPVAVVGTYSHHLYAFDVSREAITAGQRDVPVERLARQYADAKAWQIAVATVRAAVEPPPAARIVCIEALIELGDWPAAAEESERLFAVSPKSRRLGALYMIASLMAGRGVDGKALAASVAHDPVDFLATLLRNRAVWDQLPQDQLRATCKALSRELATMTTPVPLAIAATGLLLGDIPAPSEASPDIVIRDFQAVLDTVGGLLGGSSDTTEFDRMGTAPGRAFAALWPRDPVALRRLVRLQLESK